MSQSYFFYDLETSGIDCRTARVMQFAGQRTDMDFNPIGDPVNVLVKLTPDVVPEPDAIMITGITPQSTLQDGLTEREFLELFYEEIVRPGTIFLGFNTIRFDDEFIRFLHYRNFYDAYEWQWCDDCSRWDLLDVVRMTRALRPEGIEWPFTPEGRPTNRLELLTKLNGLEHEQAHDALSDVTASIAVAKLLRDKQPRLFKHLLDCRSKDWVKKQLADERPFVYVSGRYPSADLHATVATIVAEHYEQAGCTYVYDLRHDPEPFLNMDVDGLVQAIQNKYVREPGKLVLPVKEMRYNRCPAIAPLDIMADPAVQERIHLKPEVFQEYNRKLKSRPDFKDRVQAAFRQIAEARPAGKDQIGVEQAVDGQLYDGFFDRGEKAVMGQLRQAQPEEITKIGAQFNDKRLRTLVPLYKARNFPRSLTPDEREWWDGFCRKRLLEGGQASRLAKYFNRLDELARTPELDENKRYLLEELRLYGESIMPATDEV